MLVGNDFVPSHRGVGLALAERILEKDEAVRLILACRNQEKAERCQEQLRSSHPEVSTEIVQLDTSKLKSVYKAADEIRRRCVADLIPSMFNKTCRRQHTNFYSFNSILATTEWTACSSMLGSCQSRQWNSKKW